MLEMSELPGRILAKISIDQDTGCWVWTAYKNAKGYGMVHFGKKTWWAHRLTYTLMVGQIPDGLTLDHLCRVRACVRPGHLEPVTQAENLYRGDTFIAANRAKTHCPQDHEYTEENTWRSATGGRQCKTCNRINASAHYYATRSGS